MQRQAIQPNATAFPTFFAIGLCLLCVTSRADDDPKLHDYTNLDANYQRLLAFKPKKDPKTGFIVGGMNTTETIRGLQEINGIKIADLESSMRPGKLSKAGFLGDKERLLEIMAADNDWVVKARLTHQEIARHLRVLSVVSRGESKPFIYHGTRLRAKMIQYDGFQDSPFKDGTKASDDVALENLDNGEWIRYSLLVPMMIERYGFYEGKGTQYRVDPKQVVKLLSFLEVGDEAKPASTAPASKETQCVSATAIIAGCDIGGKITQVGTEPVRGRWAPLHAVIKIKNSSDKGRKLSFFCQIISQDSKNPSDAFVFSEGMYEMAIAPRETIVREFPFIDLMASMPSGYMKDTVAIRIGRKSFKRYGDHIPVEPGKKLEVSDDPVTIAVRSEGVTRKKTSGKVRKRPRKVCSQLDAAKAATPDGFRITPLESIRKAAPYFGENPFALVVYADSQFYYVDTASFGATVERAMTRGVKIDGQTGEVVRGQKRTIGK